MLQQAAVHALTAAGQESAAEAVDAAVWSVDASEVRLQTALSASMLSIAINPDAEKIVKSALRSAGAGALAGASQTAPEKKMRVARASVAGSAQAKAEGHPMVQAAKRLFDAEIQTVIDLSGGDLSEEAS